MRPGKDRAVRRLPNPIAVCAPATAICLSMMVLPASSQQIVRVDSAIACAACRIDAGPTVSLRGPFDDGSVENMALMVARDDDGRFYVIYNGSTTIGIQAPDGSWTGDSIDRAGEGPGEFRHIDGIIVHDSVIAAYDSSLRRRTEFDIRTRNVIRTVASHRGFETIILDDGRSVLSGPLHQPSGEAVGQSLHVLDVDGNLQRSFGSQPKVVERYRQALREYRMGMLDNGVLFRRLAPAGRTSFYAGYSREYRIDLWNVEGHMERSLVAQRDWFESWTDAGPYRGITRDSPPPPFLRAISVDDDGLLWVMCMRSATNWQDALSGEVGLDGNAVRIPGRPYRVMVIEVIDPTDGLLLASREFPFHDNAGFVAPGVIFQSRTDEGGRPRVEVIPLSLARR